MNPATIQFVTMVLNGLLKFVPETAADWDFYRGWVTSCAKIVNDGREPTDAEMAEAHAFAEFEHNKVQGA